MLKVCLCDFLIACGVLVVAALIRAVFGPRFTDRMVAVNCITTIIICVIAVLAVLLNAYYLLDVALIYALLGFLANVILTQLVLQRHHVREQFRKELRKETKRKEDGKA